MNITQFVKSLGIDEDVDEYSGFSTIILKNSNEYARIYSLLSTSDLVDLDAEAVVINQEISSLKYISKDYEITLSADLVRDLYKLTVEELN